MKIKILNYQDKNFEKSLEKLVFKGSSDNKKTEAIVKKIINKVKKQGDEAIIELCNQFDKANFKTPKDLLVDQNEINLAKKTLEKNHKNLIKALELSYERIFAYHQKQLPQDFFYQDNLGNNLGNIWQAIDKIAIYVPGGTATYPSSVLMNATPAIVAGCGDIVMATPSNNGKINPVVLVAAEICGIKTIYKTGGAAAIAALSFGTKTISKVDKIVGPGNSFVAIAKKQLFGQVGIDMIAGPTDILIIADDQNNPSWIAADLLSQAEHGIDSKSTLITNNAHFAGLVAESIIKLGEKLPRFEIIKKSLEKSALIVVKNLNLDAAKIANQIAPEHLEIITQNPQLILKQIKNAGTVFLGKFSPEAIGDYIAGPSHTLPTSQNAKFSSGLSVFDFLKRMSVIECSQNGFLQLQKPASLIAQSEGLEAHNLSLLIRG